MKITNQYTYKEVDRETNSETGVRYYSPNPGDKLPSVTTILGLTANPDDKKGLLAWKEWVGEKKAEQIRNEAANVGTVMHKRLEWHIAGIEKRVGSNLIHQQASNMSKVIIEHGLKHVGEVWGSEVALYFPGLYGGMTDVVGTWKGRPAIIDFKQSNKDKKPQFVKDYKAQVCAYAMAHNELYGTDIEVGSILICTRDLKYQEFVVEGKEFKTYTEEWLNRVESFYDMIDK